MTPPSTESPLTRRQLREQNTPPRRSSGPDSSIPRSSVPRPPVSRSPVPAPAYSNGLPLKSRVAKKVFSVTALLFAGALAIGTSIPANAFFTAGDASANLAGPLESQSVSVSAQAEAAEAERAKYTVTTAAEVLARTTGSRGGTFTPTTGAVRWPFPYSTSITDGFGPRKSPCAGCSTMHKGTDFTPGAGVPVYAIADGVVESSVVSGAGLGNEVIINHTIKGQAIQSVYGHMQMNSSPLHAGQTVKAGDLVGKVGATGTTTGANMHLEVHVNGVAVNAFTWLTANATDEQ